MKKLKSILPIVLSLVLVLASCSVGMAEEEIILRWLNMPCGDEQDYSNWKKELIAEFEASHPGVKIEQEMASWNDGPNKLMAAILAGDGPDIAHMGSWTTGQVYVAGGALDLTDVYDKFGGYDGTYVAGGKALCEYDGKMLGVPWGGNSRAVLIREDRLEQAGIELSDNWTWEEFIDMCRALKGVDGVEYPVGIFGNADDLFFLWNAWTVARGGEGIGVYSDDMKTATVNSEASQRALKDICDLVAVYEVANPSIVEWDGTVIESNYLNGSISVVLGSPDCGFTTTAVKQGITEKSITRSCPTVDGGYGATLHLSVNSVMSYSKHPKEAIEFLAFMNTPENQMEFNKVSGWIPARMAAWELDPRIDERMSGTLYGMENGFCIMPGNPQAINIKTIMQRACNEVLTVIATGGEYNDELIKEVLDRANIDVQAELDNIR